MNKFIKSFFLMLIFLVISISSFAGTNCEIYGEDFDSVFSPAKDIKYVSGDSYFAYWIMQEDGYYYVKSGDGSQCLGCWAYSPNFGTPNINQGIYVRFDVLFEKLTSNMHPEVIFKDDLASDSYAFKVAEVYRNNFSKSGEKVYYGITGYPTDSTIDIPNDTAHYDFSFKHELGVYDGHGNVYYTPEIQENNWYRVEMTYLTGNKADIIVTNLDTGIKIFQKYNADFILSPFKHVHFGYFNESESGSDWSSMKFDNVYIYSDDTERCDFKYTETEMNESYNEGVQDGIKKCRVHPESCGLTIMECATYNNGTLHIPCLKLGKEYWLDLKLTGTSPKITFEVEDFGVK
jgi:hypothetical protein